MKDNDPTASDSIQTDINQTRREMDDTMNKIGERLQGRHLLDEILGFFRGSSSSGGAGSKLKESADSTVRSVIGTVRENPFPALVIGGGVAWMIYKGRRRGELPRFDENRSLRSDNSYSHPGDTDSAKAACPDGEQDKNSIAETMTHATSQLKDEAAKIGTRAMEGATQAYHQGRDYMVHAVDQHPLELGLGCLALGVLSGLALPTSQRMNRVAGPRMDRLRSQTAQAGRDLLEKGKQVANAAAAAAKSEAESQGLTVDALRNRMGGKSPDHSPETSHDESKAPEQESASAAS